MAFDLDKLTTFCVNELRQFAAKHPKEVFYAFAIDDGLLCLNSEEQFALRLKWYQDKWDRKHRPIARWEDLTEEDLDDAEGELESAAEFDGLDRSDRSACLRVINAYRSKQRQKGNPYRESNEIKSLRENTGDWNYQGFVTLSRQDGFDDAACGEHYDMSDEEQKTSAYAQAMDQLIERLLECDAFSCLKTSATFYAARVEHEY